MSATIEQIKEVKTKLEKAKLEAGKIEGRIESDMDELAKLGFKDEQAAKKGLSDLQTQRDDVYKKMSNKTAKFEKKYGNLL